MAIPVIIYLQHARPVGFIIYLKHPPPLDDSGLSHIFRNAPHLAIPAPYTLNTIPVFHIYIYIILPRIWRFRLSYTFNTPDQWGSSYILNILKHPPHWTIPVYHIYLETYLIWRFGLSYTLNTPPDWAIPVFQKHLNTSLIWRFLVSYTLNTPDHWGSSYILKHPSPLGASGLSYLAIPATIYLLKHLKHSPCKATRPPIGRFRFIIYS